MKRMKNIISIILAVGLATTLFGQTKTDTLEQQFSQLSEQVNSLQSQLDSVRNQNRQLRIELDTAKSEIHSLAGQHKATSEQLGQRVETNNNDIKTLSQQLNASDTKANERITTLDDSLSKNTLYWIIAVLAIALLSVVIFVILRKQIFNEKEELSKHINEEAIKLDSKLVEVLETQLHLMKEERSSAPPKEEEIDHTLALKVADEIVRIQTNLSRMDQETKGLKQLSSSVRRIKDNFEANGYEMVEMLNQPYNEGMKVVANFRPDESLEAGQQIITRIIKPQVNFKGVMIQSAQIEVSQGE